MPRPGSLPFDLAVALRERPRGATIGELTDRLNEDRRFPVPRHSVRSALYQHLDGRGQSLFERLGRGRYGLKGGQDARASASRPTG